MRVLYHILSFLKVLSCLSLVGSLVFFVVIDLDAGADVWNLAEMLPWIAIGSIIPFGFLVLVTRIMRIALLRFRCTVCRTVFKPENKERFFSFNLIGRRRLQCPCCGRKRWCKGFV